MAREQKKLEREEAAKKRAEERKAKQEAAKMKAEKARKAAEKAAEREQGPASDRIVDLCQHQKSRSLPAKLQLLPQRYL